MSDVFLYSIGFYGLFWAIVFVFCTFRYSFGERKHINALVSKLAKNPRWFLEDRGSIVISGISAGGVFSIYCIIYPFVVHRSIRRGYKMELMKWLHWLWWLTIIFVRIRASYV
ncbi:hypothetical protein [Vibrio sp. MEBiC08052]|uniref:hypothetical protein n=1 Tax=Vibrio sp. MEBiC08052 TaxID=1761910 RepID=UPI0007410883|nr:hypothetical protein [Vibrio sp. MEBiC08052]